MATVTFDDALAQMRANTRRGGMQKSNNEMLNHMTIPQIQKAREILKNKMNSSDLSPSIQSKFKAMDAQYAIAIEKIDKVYKMTKNTATPEIRSVMEGKRNILTLNKILDATAEADPSKFDKKDNLQYGGMSKTVDFMRELNKSIPLAKLGLGVGIGMAGLGAISLIPGSMGAIGGFLAANPVFTGLVAGGAAIALAVKVVPAIYKAYKQVRENEMALHSAKADMAEAAYESEKAEEEEELKAAEEAKKKEEEERVNSGTISSDDFVPGKYEANKDALIARLRTSPSLYTTLLTTDPKPTGRTLLNLKTANLEARKLNRAMEAEERKADKDEREMNEAAVANEIVQAFQAGKAPYEIKEILKDHPELYEAASQSEELTDGEKTTLKNLHEQLETEKDLETKQNERIEKIVEAVKFGNDDSIRDAIAVSTPTDIKEARKRLTPAEKTLLDNIKNKREAENTEIEKLVDQVRNAADVEAIKTIISGIPEETYNAVLASSKLTDKQKESLKEAWEKAHPAAEAGEAETEAEAETEEAEETPLTPTEKRKQKRAAEASSGKNSPVATGLLNKFINGGFVVPGDDAKTIENINTLKKTIARKCELGFISEAERDALLNWADLQTEYHKGNAHKDAEANENSPEAIQEKFYNVVESAKSSADLEEVKNRIKGSGLSREQQDKLMQIVQIKANELGSKGAERGEA